MFKTPETITPECKREREHHSVLKAFAPMADITSLILLWTKQVIWLNFMSMRESKYF